MSTQQTKIFYMGATGFIGGAVLNRLLEHPDASTFAFTALVRSSLKASKLEAIGVKAVVGSLKDEPLVESLAADADMIISMADCDDVDIAKSYLRGMKKCFEVTGKAPILLHTVGVLADNSAGFYNASATIYNDADPDQIETLAITQQHRTVDIELVKADKEGYMKAYLVLPSMIYGLGQGCLVDLGIQNQFSIQIPQIIQASLARDLYIILFNLIRQNPDSVAHGREGFYFGIASEYNLYDVGKAIGEKLVSLGRATTSEPTTFTDEEINLHFGGSTFWGTNSRGLSTRSKSIGWNPKKTAKDLAASIGPEVDAILQLNAARERGESAQPINAYIPIPQAA
ncbi:hypothetical protein D9613_011857 [Agrocybe pediades]|uniref:NAD(P)-binding domain-containing protein n=1 Tax=Agrocybe pediades TaxID=84607 RepID=A0A8H4VJY7_9AGAR|nr:hypothetical protein D9613_011857 [Agrocybe pediades]